MSGKDSKGNPTARDEGILAERVGDETVVYDTENTAAHCLKPVAAAVFARCDGQRSVQDISRLVSEDLGYAVDVESVESALAELADHSLLVIPEEPLSVSISRRQMLSRTATVGGAAMAVPLISSIVAPTPAFAVINCYALQSTTPIACNTAQDCGCPSGGSGNSCSPSHGTCGCYAYGSGPNGGFTSCGKPPTGFSGWCAFHSASGSHSCVPDCANPTSTAGGAPPCH